MSTITACGATIEYADGMYYSLTPCCGASATGTQDGVACRGCYQPVEDRFGACATSLGELANLLALFGCICPSDCASHTAWQLTPCAHPDELHRGSDWRIMPSGARERIWWCAGCGADLHTESQGGLHASLIQS